MSYFLSTSEILQWEHKTVELPQISWAACKLAPFCTRIILISGCTRTLLLLWIYLSLLRNLSGYKEILFLERYIFQVYHISCGIWGSICKFESGFAKIMFAKDTKFRTARAIEWTATLTWIVSNHSKVIRNLKIEKWRTRKDLLQYKQPCVSCTPKRRQIAPVSTVKMALFTKLCHFQYLVHEVISAES